MKLPHVVKGQIEIITTEQVMEIRVAAPPEWQAMSLPGEAPRLAPVKTTASNRTVPLPQGYYYASLLIRHGESVKIVQARLVHASAAETLDTYSHLWPDSAEPPRSAGHS